MNQRTTQQGQEDITAPFLDQMQYSNIFTDDAIKCYSGECFAGIEWTSHLSSFEIFDIILF